MDHAVVGGVVAVVVFAMLCLLIILGRYFARHKGKTEAETGRFRPVGEAPPRRGGLLTGLGVGRGGRLEQPALAVTVPNDARRGPGACSRRGGAQPNTETGKPRGKAPLARAAGHQPRYLGFG